MDNATQMKALRWISEEYHGLNGNQYDILDCPPSPLEFSRLARISRPFLIKGSKGNVHTDWTDEILIRSMGDHLISVAVTPNGHADAVTLHNDGKLYFAEPHVEKMTMTSFLANLSTEHPRKASIDSDSRIAEVYYLQSQNGNMYTSRYFDPLEESEHSEFDPLREKVPSEVSWSSEALDKKPDAVNLWIGDSRSITSIHSDPYENIYRVVRGVKHFILLPPTEGWCLQERTYPHAAYNRSPITSKLELVPSSSPPVRWSSIRAPEIPGSIPSQSHPIHISVEAGDTLYLPAGWWHHVRQSGVTIAINYWYDMESRGMAWVWLNFLRGTNEPPSGNNENDEDGQ